MSEDVKSIIEAQQEADRIERERIKELKKLELAELLKKQMDEDSKISEDEIRAYDEFMKTLSLEDITEAFSRQKPELEDITVDSNGRELSYERSVVRKPPDVSLDLTREHIEEMNYCFKHPIYMIKNYIKIINQDKGIMNFKMYPYQAQYIKDCFANKRLISCWGRQSGKTTSSSAFMLLFTLFNKDKTVAIVANKQATSKEILDRIKLMYDYLPMWLKPGIIEWNKNSVKFDNGCKIIAAATSSDSIRGQAVSLLYIDEFAFIPKNLVNEFIESTFPVISSSKLARILITSTPNGKNHFYKFYEEARLKKSTFTHSKINWYDVPGRDEKWRLDQIKELGSIEKFNQEYGAEFANASNMAFKTDTINHIEKLQVVDPLIDNVKRAEGLRIFQRPIKGRKYLISADVAGGKNRDYSTMVVIDITTDDFNIVATYRSDEIHTSDYPAMIYNIALYYYGAYIIIENNGLGDGVANDLWHNYEYTNIFSADFTKEQRYKKGFYKDIGIKTNKKNKKAGVLFLSSMLDKYQINIPDIQIVDELYTFIKNDNDTYSASTGNHDDFVMNLVLFAYLAKTRESFELIRSTFDVEDDESDDGAINNVLYVEGGKGTYRDKDALFREADEKLYNILLKDSSTDFDSKNKKNSLNFIFPK